MQTQGQFEDRVCNEVKPIPIKPLDTNILFRDGKPNWKLLKEHFKHQGCISREDALRIINEATLILQEEPNICTIKDPVVIVGDIHGQYYDLIKVIQLGGDPSTSNYLFMGDYVDRGSFSVEVILLLLTMKINFKANMIMLRGNHESRTMSLNFDFKKQVEYKQDTLLWEKFMECFDALPLGCMMDKFIVFHGGIGPEVNIDKIKMLNRFCEPPKEGILCDILWSDPIDEKSDDKMNKNQMNVNVETNKPKDIDTWAINDMRGCSQYYGKTVTRKFLEENKLQSLIRAHEAQFDGFKFNQFQLQNNNKMFPQVITIFSAPNQCGQYGNYGAIMKLKGTDIKIEKYGESKKPQVLPNVMDVFDWSIPFLAENITGVMKVLLGGSESKLTKDEDNKFKQHVSDKIDTDFNKKEIIKKKVRFIGRLAKMLSTIKEENNLINEIKKYSDKIPKGALLGGKNMLEDQIKLFKDAQKNDKSEKIPDKK